MAVEGTPVAPGKIGIHADAWGIRKLMSHCLRALRLRRVPRVLRLIQYYCILGLPNKIYRGLSAQIIRTMMFWSCSRSSRLLGAWIPFCQTIGDWGMRGMRLRRTKWFVTNFTVSKTSVKETQQFCTFSVYHTYRVHSCETQELDLEGDSAIDSLPLDMDPGDEDVPHTLEMDIPEPSPHAEVCEEPGAEEPGAEEPEVEELEVDEPLDTLEPLPPNHCEVVAKVETRDPSTFDTLPVDILQVPSPSEPGVRFETPSPIGNQGGVVKKRELPSTKADLEARIAAIQ